MCVCVFLFLLLISCSYSLAIVDGREVQHEISVFSHIVTAPSGPGPPHNRGLTAPPKHTTLGRTPLDECSARNIALFLTHNNQKRQTFMSPAEFELVVPTSERPLGSAKNKLYSFGRFYVKNAPLIRALRFCTVRTALRGSRGIALPFHGNGTRRG